VLRRPAARKRTASKRKAKGEKKIEGAENLQKVAEELDILSVSSDGKEFLDGMGSPPPMED
jgi:hypothetical protein